VDQQNTHLLQSRGSLGGGKIKHAQVGCAADLEIIPRYPGRVTTRIRPDMGPILVGWIYGHGKNQGDAWLSRCRRITFGTALQCRDRNTRRHTTGHRMIDRGDGLTDDPAQLSDRRRRQGRNDLAVALLSARIRKFS
jgi:hypothetical protein